MHHTSTFFLIYPQIHIKRFSHYQTNVHRLVASVSSSDSYEPHTEEGEVAVKMTKRILLLLEY